MLINGDAKEASFCKLIKMWYEAEANPAICKRETPEMVGAQKVPFGGC